MKMIFQLLMFVQMAASLHLPNTEEKFMKFVARYNKPYQFQGEEYFRRIQIYADNLEEIKQHNAEPVKWKKAENKFSDMTAKEFKEIYGTGYLNIYRPTAAGPTLLGGEKYSGLPEHRDWRNEGVITAVKDQGQCGSCWAHAGTEQLESYLTIETKFTLTNLSVQQITSCTTNTMQCGGRGGCRGSIAQFAFNYAEFIGVVSEEEYPYISGDTFDTEPCYYNATKENAIAFVRGQETLPHNDYHSILRHIANVGPLAISVASSGWQSYEGGVFDGCSYGENIDMDHAVQLVGYGTDSENGDYWLVRNSWGSDWGENGYIRLLREHDEVKCGIDTTPMHGSGCKYDGVYSQKVCGMCGVLFEATYPIGTESLRYTTPPDVSIIQV